MTETADAWAESPSIEAQTFAYLKRGMTAFWKLTKPEHKSILGAVGILILGQIVGVFIPILFTNMTEDVVELVRKGERELALESVAIVLAILGVLTIALSHLHHYVQEPLFLRGLIRLENMWPCIAQQKLLALSIHFHERENTGKKIEKVNKGVERMVGILGDLFWSLAPQLTYVLFNMVAMILLDWRIGLFFILPFIPAVWIQMRSYRRFYPVWEEWEKKKEESVGLLCESVINVRTVVRFVTEVRERSKLSEVRAYMRDLDFESALGIQNYFFAMDMVLRGSFYATLAFGLYLFIEGSGSMATVMYVFVVGKVMLESVWGMVQVYSRLLRHIIAAERLQGLLDEKEEVTNTAPGVVPHLPKGEIRFENVSMTYPGSKNAVLNSITLSVHPGEMLALVGKSGSGKSTIANLLSRMMDVTEGSITIDGFNIKDMDRNVYRGRFAIVPQDVELFGQTIYKNIRIANPDATDEQLELALKAASLDETLKDTRRFPLGVHTLLGERGVNLSGGERQRVGIARAVVSILAGAKVLLLDEATSALDSESERTVQKVISWLRQEMGFTIVVIAHRLSTIMMADRICVLDKGEIVECGNHETLLKQNGLYHRLVSLQTLGELRE